MVPVEALKATWPVLLVLVYLMISCMLTVLGSYYRHAIRVHDLVASSKRKRIEYQRMLAERNRVIEEDTEAEPAPAPPVRRAA